MKNAWQCDTLSSTSSLDQLQGHQQHMSDLEDRLNRAIKRGQGAKDLRGKAEGAKKASEEDLRNLHSKLRLTLSEHIEKCLRQLMDHFPGFEFSTVLNEEGWGARITRDDVRMQRGTSKNQYSRLEMLIRPWSTTNILELVTKGTIRNRESLNRNNFRMLSEATEDGFREVIDGLVVEFAEQYAAHE